MRFLLLSDTHGNLGIINALAAKVRADAVIHAGDFGFYDDGSYERLSEREIGLQITHSGLPRDEKARMLALARAERIIAVRTAKLLGEFQSFLDGAVSFDVPVYAVWGNHEDRNVVERVVRGDIKVDNLHVLVQSRLDACLRPRWQPPAAIEDDAKPYCGRRRQDMDHAFPIR